MTEQRTLRELAPLHEALQWCITGKTVAEIADTIHVGKLDFAGPIASSTEFAVDARCKLNRGVAILHETEVT